MNRFVGMIEKLNVDAVLVLDYSNIKYACGYKADFAFLLYTKVGNYYFTDGRFTIEAKDMLSIDYKIIEINAQNAMNIIYTTLVEDGVNSIAIDTDISYYRYREVQDNLGNKFNLKDCTDDLLKVRQIKDTQEMESITKAQEIAEKSLTQLMSEIRVGISERELAAKLEYLMRINGSDGYSFSSIVAFGANSAYAHARPSDNKLKIGDIILIDFGATHAGYCSDMTRTFIFGETNAEVERLYEAVLDANEQCIKSIKPGMIASDMDLLAREILEKHGVANLFTHSLGHGVGIDIHEMPYLSQKGKGVVLEAGMVVTIEPGVYISGLGGIRIEDMVMLTEDGAVNLTKYPKKFTLIR